MRKDEYECDNCGVTARARYNGSVPEGWFSMTLHALPAPYTRDACSIECFRGLAESNALLSVTGG
jgi:hypothetical protein